MAKSVTIAIQRAVSSDDETGVCEPDIADEGLF